MMHTHRPYKIGRLYFRYIANTPAERNGWSAAQLALVLSNKGFIKIVEIQGFDKKGRWTEKVTRYFELKPLSHTTILEVMRGLK